MTPQQIVALAVRLFVIWMVVTFFIDIPFSYLEYRQQLGSGVAVFYAVVVVVMAAIMVILWRFPLTVAGKLLSAEMRDTQESPSPDLWLAMGCSLIGLWILGSMLPWFTQEMYFVLSGDVSGDAAVWYTVSRYIVEIVVGVWLLLGARGFRKLFWWIRNAGHYQPKGPLE